MATKKVQIGIDVTANTKGADQAADSVKKVADTAEKAAARSEKVDERNAQKEIATSRRKANAKIADESRVTKAVAKEIATRDKLEAEAEAKSGARAKSGSNKKSQLAAQVGFQVQDIAVQAQAGVKATTILAQQGSQLLGAFGPTGAIAGAILAMGAVAAGVFFGMEDDTEKVKKKAELLVGALEKIKENAEKIQSEEIDMGRTAIDEAIRLTKILRDGYNEVAAAELKYSDQALQSVEMLRQAQVQLMRLKGEEVDEIAEAKKDDAARIQQIEQKKQAELMAQSQRLQAAEDERKAAQEVVDARAFALVQTRDQLAVMQAQVEAIKAQKAELEKTSKEMTFTMSGMEMANVPSDKAEAAKRTLKETPFDAQIQSLEGKINSLWKDTADGTGKLYEDLMQGIQALNEVNAKIPQLAAVVSEESNRIVLAADTEGIKAGIEARTQEAKTNAESVNNLLKDFVPVTEQQAQALAIIKEKTANLQITADEAPVVATNLQLIRNSLKVGQEMNVKNTDDMIQIMNTYNLKLIEQNNQIKRVEAGIIR